MPARPQDRATPTPPRPHPLAGRVVARATRHCGAPRPRSWTADAQPAPGAAAVPRRHRAARRRSDSHGQWHAERAHQFWLLLGQRACGEEQRKVFVRHAKLRDEEVPQPMPSQLSLEALPGIEAPGHVYLAVEERWQNIQFLGVHQHRRACATVVTDEILHHRRLELGAEAGVALAGKLRRALDATLHPHRECGRIRLDQRRNRTTSTPRARMLRMLWCGIKPKSVSPETILRLGIASPSKGNISNSKPSSA